MNKIIKITIDKIAELLNDCMVQMVEENKKLDEEKHELIKELDAKTEKIEELKGIIKYYEISFSRIIDCGVGKIEYASGNLLLQQLMESLEEKIKGSNAAAVLSAINNI